MQKWHCCCSFCFKNKQICWKTEATGKGSTMIYISERKVKVIVGITDLQYFKILMIVLLWGKKLQEQEIQSVLVVLPIMPSCTSTTTMSTCVAKVMLHLMCLNFLECFSELAWRPIFWQWNFGATGIHSEDKPCRPAGELFAPMKKTVLVFFSVPAVYKLTFCYASFILLLQERWWIWWQWWLWLWLDSECKPSYKL